MIENVEKKQPTVVVGIGASAGGLDALKNFFKTVPKDSGMAFIVVQHLDPNHKSMMADILGRESNVPIHEAKNRKPIEANNAYIIPPNAYIEVSDGTIKISRPKQKRGSRMSIDYLFRSIGKSYKAQGVGILFSGAGSDGTAGLRVLKAEGGLSIVQTPKQAEHPSMPRSAIDAGVVDQILDIDEIVDVLIDYAKHPYVEFEKDAQDEAEEDLRTIGALLKARDNFDLSQYKESTVYRRICRRMSLTGKAERRDYIDFLRENIDERQYLMQDLLINVTDFFRDPKAFDVLEEKAINNIIQDAEHGSDIRVWVAGCATGEEAYSLAMLILEKIEASGKDLDLKVFATDVDDDAIKTARRGVYPVSIISELPDSYLEKYFKPLDDNYYKILTHLRDKVSFATQNVYADPPFSKMDLISCRNLLIYLRQSVQKRVLKSFYFALNTHGYLFLGSSESIGEQKSLFKQLSQKWRIFQKQDNVRQTHNDLGTPSFYNKKPPTPHLVHKKVVSKGPEPADQAREALLKCVGPSVLINGDNQVLYLHGNLKKFIQIPQGEPNLDFIGMLDSELRTRVRSALFKARRSREKVVVHSPASFGNDDDANKDAFQVKIFVADHMNFDEDSLIISFEDISEEHYSKVGDDVIIGSDDQDKMIEAMERELFETREELQNTAEELETSTEELKASHEEALSTNEELQSANEELEASTEELRSLNEELTTVNSQLKDKIGQLQNAHEDLENFFASTNLATIFLCSEFKIMRYTPAAERLLRMGPQDIGRPINEISRILIDEETLDDARQVLESLEGAEKEIETEDGRWFVRKILPYRTEDKRIIGVVLTFNDVSELKKATQNVEVRENQHAVVAKLGLEALRSDDIQELMDHIVREVAYTLEADFCKVLRYYPNENEFVMKAGIGWKSGLVGKATLPADTNSQAGYTLKERGPVIVEDLSKEKRFAGPTLLTDHNVVSGMSCIIENGEQPYGVLGVHSRDKKAFTKDDANFLMSIANLLSIAVHRKRANEELEENQSKLMIAKDSHAMGMHEYDVRTGKIKWDSLLHHMWGTPEDQPVSIDEFYEGLHPDDVKATKQAVERVFNKGSSGHYHAFYRVINKKTQELRWAEATGRVVYEKGEPTRLIGMVIDITDVKKMESSLHKAVENLESENQKKNEFLATLGHELRNPLAAINSGVQIMQLDIAESKWALDMMANNVKLISSLLDDLLDLTRIARGKIKLKKEVVCINEILVETLEGFLPKVAEKDQKLDFDIADDPIFINGDRTRLEQVFSNLLTNANKFTPEKGRIKAKLYKDDNSAIIQISDNGVGIDKSMFKKIFDPFEQAVDSKMNEAGLGIGLSLVHQFVRLHKGNTNVESKGKNKGATFTITLPLAEEGAVPVQRVEQKNRGIKDNLRVMIIDDNKDAVRGLKSMLQREKCQVNIAYTGDAALKKVKDFKPQALIVDIGLPDINGYELIKEIKDQYQEGSLYIAVTGYGHNEAREKSKTAGFDYHLNKPANLNKLLEILSSVNS